MTRRRTWSTAAIAALLACPAWAAHTNNILLTGYWPPTNDMVRPFSTNPEQNPDGWIGENWEGRGYNVYSYFAEFPSGGGRGSGDLEVDYQDTSEDFWRIANEVKPVAIITFSKGSLDHSWEVEQKQRNLEQWVDDYRAPRQPTPSPPDASVPADFVRESSLPMTDIVGAVNAADGLNLDAFIDHNGYGGGFLSEFIAYHGVWYQSLHSDPSDDAWTVAAGHIHVGGLIGDGKASRATKITLRTLLDYVDTVVPEPTTGLMMLIGCGLLGIRRR